MPKLIRKTQVESPWKEKRIKIFDANNGLSVKVEAKCMGNLAVHHTIKESREILSEFSVTHIPSSRLIATVAKEEDATRIGDYVWSKCCLLFNKDDLAEIQEELPPWLKPWVTECTSKKSYISPLPFINKVKE